VSESMGALAELRDEGKIRHIGVSNVSEDQLREAQKVTPVVSVQNRYNLGDRSSEAMVDLCDTESLAFLPWAPIQDTDRLPPVLTAAHRLGATTRQVALAWLLGRSAQILPIPGSGSGSHVRDNVAAASLQLTNEEANAILELAMS
jgi:pyridoxine 4-dehydrogenase